MLDRRLYSQRSVPNPLRISLVGRVFVKLPYRPIGPILRGFQEPCYGGITRSWLTEVEALSRVASECP